jgi:hypothetical protein
MSRTIKRHSIFLAGLICLIFQARAAVPPAEQLLPDETLGLISIPDWAKVEAYSRQFSWGQLWQDPAIKPFKDHFLKRLKEDAIDPLERELGIKFADYTSLIQGQVTFAVTRNGWDGSPDKSAAIMLLIDTKGKSDQMKSLLAALKKKWVDSGKQIKTERVRDVEFSTLLVRRNELSSTLKKVFPASDPGGDAPEKPDAQAKDSPLEITIGQSDSLLIIGNTAKGLEKVLIRQSGGSLPALAEQSAYESSQAMFRDALAFGWLDFKPIYDVLKRQSAAPANSAGAGNLLGQSSEKILAATGLGGLKTIGFKWSGGPEGSFGEIFVGVPESSRQGLFKIVMAEPKEAAPPPFVPGDAVKFNRWRLNGQKAWAGLESLLASISPEISSAIQLFMSFAGKDKDPNFDLKKNLIGNLGDDFISFEKNPRSSTPSDLASPPTLYLIGSPNAEQLAQALNASASILPTATGSPALKEREFLGRKVYTLSMPSGGSPDSSKNLTENFNFAASGGYVALSADVALLEEFLRSSESSAKTLRETAGLSEAAQKVGGMSTGFFGYENQSETLRVSLETLKSNSARLDRILSFVDKPGADKDASNMKDWFDLALLPSFERIAKYFHFMVYSMGSNSEGMAWKVFFPAPPQLK